MFNHVQPRFYCAGLCQGRIATEPFNENMIQVWHQRLVQPHAVYVIGLGATETFNRMARSEDEKADAHASKRMPQIKKALSTYCWIESEKTIDGRVR